MLTYPVSPKSVKDREAAESHNQEKLYKTKGRWTFNYSNYFFFLIIHCLVSDVPALFRLKNNPSFPIFFFFKLNVPWTTHLLHPTKGKYHFRGSLQTLCSSVKQLVIKYWWCKFLHGWDAAPGTFKCLFKTKIHTSWRCSADHQLPTKTLATYVWMCNPSNFKKCVLELDTVL